MSDDLRQWLWVVAAWAQVVLAYLGYLAYVGWRRRRLLEDDRAQRLLQQEAVARRGSGR